MKMIPTKELENGLAVWSVIHGRTTKKKTNKNFILAFLIKICTYKMSCYTVFVCVLICNKYLCILRVHVSTCPHTIRFKGLVNN